MTVSYTGNVANATTFGCFTKILAKWRGSLYKLVYKELLAYILAYLIINLTYRMVIVPHSECDQSLPICQQWKTHREMFESLRLYCNTNLKSIPLTFMLGFYVSLIVSRWWVQYTLLPWPDSFAMLVTALVQPDSGNKGRLVRRNMVRYVTLSYCISLRTVSWRLKKRFPTLEHLVGTGIMRQDELLEFRRLDNKTTANKWFLPLVWASKMVGAGVEDGTILPPTAGPLVAELGRVRQNLQTLLSYDWLSVPLAYTQTVTLAVYLYFTVALFGSQWVMPANSQAYRQIYKTSPGNYSKMDLFFPFTVILQFVFYLGWLKVAETLINPFGEDDDDFELNRLLDRHLQVGFMICDPTVTKPDLLKDKFWDDVIPQDLPYTIASMQYQGEEFKGSAELTLNLKDSDKIYSEARFSSSNSPNLKLRRGVKDDLYESIRTVGERTHSRRLAKQVLTRNMERRLVMSRQNSDSSVVSSLYAHPTLPWQRLSKSHMERLGPIRKPTLPRRASFLRRVEHRRLTKDEVKESYGGR